MHRLTLSVHWGKNHKHRMVLARALLAWSVVLIRSVSAKRIVMEHERMVKDGNTPQQVEGKLVSLRTSICPLDHTIFISLCSEFVLCIYVN